MGSIVLNCPHCFKENVSFQSVAQTEQTTKGPKGELIYLVFFICGNCQSGVIERIIKKKGKAPHDYPAGIDLCSDYEILE
jgi:transcription elongation factor Elf1